MSCPLITEVAPISCAIVYALMATVGLVWLILLTVAWRVILISRAEPPEPEEPEQPPLWD